MSVKSPLIRLAPLQYEDLPAHPSFTSANQKPGQSRPDLLSFTLTTLDQGRALVLPKDFNLVFSSHSWKPSPPSNNEVEILSAEVPSSAVQSIPWASQAVPRPKPAKIRDEFWYARRSYHHNLSNKRNAPGTASFEEFIYGLRDKKSQREAEFTHDLYDAHHICDWNEELAPLLATADTTNQRDGSPKYTHVTMSIYEMCHKLPSPAAPRCFPVLVLTASVSPDEFIAVTLPVDISTCPLAFYSNKRNQKEGSTSQSRKSVTIGNYVAVERVHKYPSTREHAKDAKGEKIGREHSRADSGEEIEWVMATASHAKGSIPMTLQRMGVPGAIAKDVGLFLKWIRDVPEEEIAKVKNAEGDGSANPNAHAHAHTHANAGGSVSATGSGHVNQVDGDPVHGGQVAP